MTEQKKIRVYDETQYHTWVGYTWSSFAVYAAQMSKAYRGFCSGYEYAHDEIYDLIERIETLPFMLCAYHAFLLLAVCCYVRMQDTATEDQESDNYRMYTTFEDAYNYVKNPSRAEYDFDPEDIYNFVKRLTTPYLNGSILDTSFSPMLLRIHELLSVKRGKGYSMKPGLSTHDITLVLGRVAGQLLTSGLPDYTKQARIEKLCQIIQRVI